MRYPLKAHFFLKFSSAPHHGTASGSRRDTQKAIYRREKGALLKYHIKLDIKESLIYLIFRFLHFSNSSFFYFGGKREVQFLFEERKLNFSLFRQTRANMLDMLFIQKPGRITLLWDTRNFIYKSINIET